MTFEQMKSEFLVDRSLNLSLDLINNVHYSLHLDTYLEPSNQSLAQLLSSMLTHL